MPSPHPRRRGGRPRPRRLVALLAVPALVASLLTPGHSVAATNPAAPNGPTSPETTAERPLGGVEPVPVTLITGDTVFWRDTGNGQVVNIEQAERDHPVTFDQSGTREDFYVIPSDVAQQVGESRLDRELFNIPRLIEQGFDDRTTGGDLPVIVTFDTYTPGRGPAAELDAHALAARADTLPATADPVGVAGIHGAGVTINRDHATSFRNAVLTPVNHRTSRGLDTAGHDLGASVESVRLDRVYEVDLDESVPQIGAPEAWDAGYTGQGVTVAVLDTGIDATHPDLQGQVVAAQNFTGPGEPIDDHGHGTHVASTIAGTGAASDGLRRGVAPDADLLAGKVCNSEGNCLESWIMAGMEWAAATQDADVVNMSLGGGPTDGTDPMSQLINDLSEQTGALFVTSAGNSGCRGLDRTIGSPAAADAALAVAAVDKAGRWARFSSCGPRVGDHAVKPEIAAPGVNIVAARADGTSLGTPVDADYTSSNGTSMASPHVAGAAALLAQAQPDLDPRSLKDALVSTAADGGLLLVQQGTGRVDVPAALNSPIYAQGTVSFGAFEGQAEQDITYTNHSDNDITLNLDASPVTTRFGQPTDAAALSLSGDTLTVPARGSAIITAVATLDTSNLSGQESYSGVVTATGAGVNLRTAIGLGPPLHKVTIDVLDSNGNRIGTQTAPDTTVKLIYDTFDFMGGTSSYDFVTRAGIATGHVPTGVFTFIVNVDELDPATGQRVRGSLLTEVEVNIAGDTTLTLDARDAVPVQVTVPRKVDKRNHEVSLIRELGNGSTYTRKGGAGHKRMYVEPAPAGELANLALYVSWTLAQPQPVRELPWLSPEDCFGSPTRQHQVYHCYSDAPAYIYSLPFFYENGIPGDLHEKVTRADIVEVPRRYHSDYPDAFITHQFDSPPPFGCVCGGGVGHRIWFRPGEVTEYMLADDRFTWAPAGAALIRRQEGEPQTGIALFSSDVFPTVEAGSRRPTEDWFGAPLRMGAVDVREEFLDNPNENRRFAVMSRGGADGNSFATGFNILGNDRGHFGNCTICASWRMWNLDTGAELQPAAHDWHFQLAGQASTYRLEQVEAYPDNTAPVFRTGRATTTWTFTSRPADQPVPDGYQCPLSPVQVCQIQPMIQLEYELGLDIGNRAPAGRTHAFAIAAGQHSKAIDHATVTHLSVEASFDDGDTWTEARVVGRAHDTWDTGGYLPAAEPYQQYTVVLKHPPLHRTNGYVTLRVQAQDANGGTIEQTIDRAYLLK